MEKKALQSGIFSVSYLHSPLLRFIILPSLRLLSPAPPSHCPLSSAFPSSVFRLLSSVFCPLPFRHLSSKTLTNTQK